MSDKMFELVTKDHYFRTEGTICTRVEVGATISDLIDAMDVPSSVRRDLLVVISLGLKSYDVPLNDWPYVKPKAGCHVLIAPRVEGPAAAVVLAALVPLAAGSIAGALFTAGTLAFAIAEVAISIVGSLLINALIPPPSAPKSISEDDPNFSITGSANAENRYGIYPTVLGRHKIFPPKTARGYTEGAGEEIYYRGRFTFGYGPVALEDLRIGSTAITEFEGVELEFLNVDQSETLARMPDLAPLVRAWRQGDERLTLYPDDIAEDAEQVRLSKDAPVVRTTRERATSVSLDISFQGLVRFDGGNNKQKHSATFRFRMRRLGTDTWAPAGTNTYTGASTASLRFTKVIQLPDSGEYDIEVTRTSDDSEDTSVRDDAYLTAVRSVQSGSLPSHSEIAEVAVRIKASDQLNGQLDGLNAKATMMAPVWDGQQWSAPKPVRHPAWLYARALMGPIVDGAVSPDRVQLQDLLDWAQQEPHWTCDMVIDQPSQVGEILDAICASGRARRTLRDLKYSIIRDGGAGPVIQQFSPRNTWDFQGQITFPKQIHGFRVRFVSESLDWQQDEIAVYADGYNASNATELETLDLRGVVLTKDQVDGGNAWRLARYALAQAVLRPETFEWKCDIEHLRVGMGDKVRLVHDVPMIGVGYARIRSVNEDAGDLTGVVLDDLMSVEDRSYRMIVRSPLGDEVVFSATPPASYDGIWTVEAGQSVAASEVARGDLVLIELMTQESVEVLVKSIRHGSDLSATLTGVPAAPEVLQADQGAIPAYVPTITKVLPRERLLPGMPNVRAVRSIYVADPPRVVARVSVEEVDRFDGGVFHAVVLHPSGDITRHGPLSGSEFDFILPEFGVHAIELRRENASGQLSLPAKFDATWSVGLTQPAVVENFRVRVVGDQARLSWAVGADFVSHYHIRHSVDPEGGWAGAQDVAQNATGLDLLVPALPGAYLIRAVSHFGSHSARATVVQLNSPALAQHNVVEVVSVEPEFSGLLDEGLSRQEQGLSLYGDGSIFVWDDLFQVEDVYSHGGVAEFASYQVAEIIDLGGVSSSRISVDVRGFGFDVVDSIFAWPDLHSLPDVFGDVGDLWRIFVQISLTDDDPNDATAIWTDWSDLLVSDYVARGLRFRVQFESLGVYIAVVLKSLSITVDMPDRVSRLDDVLCPGEGVQVTFEPPFMAKPAIVVDGQGLPSGARSIRTGASRFGFHQKFVDSAGDPVAASFDFTAAGYGRDLSET